MKHTVKLPNMKLLFVFKGFKFPKKELLVQDINYILSFWKYAEVGTYDDIKETVSRDFLPLGFFVKHFPLGHCFTPLNVFANNIEFTEIFELKVDSAVPLTPLSQKNLLTQSPFFKLFLKDGGHWRSPLLGFHLTVSLKKMRALKNSKIDSAVFLLTQRCQ